MLVKDKNIVENSDIIYEHIEKMLEGLYIELFVVENEMVGIVGEMKYDLGLDLAIFYVILVYGFIVWLLMKWNKEDV